MIKKILQILFLGLVCLILIIVPGYRIALGGRYQQISYIDGRKLATFPIPSIKKFKLALISIRQGKIKEAGDLFFNQFIDRSFQKYFEKAAADQFPFRIPAIQIAKLFEREMINLAYIFQNDPAIPADTHSELYVMRDSSLLLNSVNTFSPDVKASIDTRIQNYVDLVRLYPEQKFYLFYLQRLYDSPYHPLLKYYNNGDVGQSFQYFKDNKPKGLILGDFLFSSFEDQINYFFRTDHHWNIRGACLGYQEIYKMLSTGYPTISSLLNCDKFITIPNFTFLGSQARQTLYPVQADKFEIANVTLPAYRAISNGVVTYHDQGPQKVISNSCSDPYCDLYGIYFGANIPLEEYIFDNESHLNAIIIHDSYVNPIKPYLAYHYNHTYFVDFRGFVNFSLGDLLKKYQIDDVIIIGDNKLTLTSKDWLINP
jgi:hypothetical protein